MPIGNKPEHRPAMLRRQPSYCPGERRRQVSASEAIGDLAESVILDGDTRTVLRQLEAENATLRHRAVHLALEIQDLTGNRERTN